MMEPRSPFEEPLSKDALPVVGGDTAASPPTLEPDAAGSLETHLTIKHMPAKATQGGAIGAGHHPASAEIIPLKGIFAWPRSWQLALGFLLGILALGVGQSAWKRLERPQPLSSISVSIDLNSADLETLKQLPGVGPQLAARIIDYRQQHGPFRSVDDLGAVSGIGPVTLARLRAVVFVSTQETKPNLPQATQAASARRKVARAEKSSDLLDRLVDLNTATREELMRIPGIGPVMAERILEDKQKNGPFTTVADLTRIKGIKAKTLEKWQPFLTVTPRQQSKHPPPP